MHTPHTPSISIILLNYNGEKWLRRCLQSIEEQTIFEHLELIVADNASTDGSAVLAEQLLKSWRNGSFLQNGANIGFGAGSNRAVAKARGKYLFFLNPDVWLEKECLRCLYEGTERAGAGAGGLLVLDYDDDTLQTRGASNFDICGHLVMPPAGIIPKRLFCAAGFYFIRTDLFRAIGGFDEHFFLYGEETDLSWRVWISGESIVHVPEARMHHRGAASVNPAGGTKIVENRTSDAKRYYANRNHLITLLKNCQHLLLLLLIPCVLQMLLESLIGALWLRRWSFFHQTFFQVIAGVWRLRSPIREQRRKVRAFRRRSDFYLLRFLTWRFNRWHEFRRLIALGAPKVDPQPATQQR